MSNEQLPPSSGGTPDESTRPVPRGEEPGPPGSALPASGTPAPERPTDTVNPGVDAPGTGRSGPVSPEPDGPLAQPPGAFPAGPTPSPDPPFSAPGGWAGAPAEAPAPPGESGAPVPGPWAVGPVATGPWATGPESPDPATSGMTGAGAPESPGAASGGTPVPGALGSGPPPVGGSGVPAWAPPPGSGPDRARTARTAVLVAVAVGALVLAASAGFAAGRFSAGDTSRDGAPAARGLPGQRPYGEDGGGEGLRGPERGLDRGAVAVGQVVAVDGSTFTLQALHGTVTVTTSGSTLINGATGTQLSTLTGQVVLVRGGVNSDGTVAATLVATRPTDGRGEDHGRTGQSGTAGAGTGQGGVG